MKELAVNICSVILKEPLMKVHQLTGCLMLMRPVKNLHGPMKKLIQVSWDKRQNLCATVLE
jgi:hypothetical protein